MPNMDGYICPGPIWSFRSSILCICTHRFQAFWSLFARFQSEKSNLPNFSFSREIAVAGSTIIGPEYSLGGYISGCSFVTHKQGWAMSAFLNDAMFLMMRCLPILNDAIFKQCFDKNIGLRCFGLCFEKTKHCAYDANQRCSS